MATFFVADYDISTYEGGAEKVDYTIYTKLKIPFIKSTELPEVYSSQDFYIISNAVFLPVNVRTDLINNKNYLIIEHDYKMHPTRQPSRYQGHIFPKHELINLDYYHNARHVLAQSNNHLNGLKLNSVADNVIALQGSFWNEDEIFHLRRNTKQLKNYKYCIVGLKSPDKGQDISVDFCNRNGLDYEILPTLPLFEFYREMSNYSTLVNFPRVRESFCRLVVEARALHCNVITNKNYGATEDPWFSKSGHYMIDFLEESTKKNLELIKSLIP